MTIKRILFFSLLILNVNLVHSMHGRTMHDEAFMEILPPVPQEIGAHELTCGYEYRDRHGKIKTFPFFKLHVKKWLKRGANINCCSLDGRVTPLSRAILLGDLKRCKILLELGADVNGAAANWTPLAALIACQAPYDVREEIKNLLVARNVDINKPSERTGITPLMVACYKHENNHITWLLNQGADSQATDFIGNTALIWAMNYYSFLDPIDHFPLLLAHKVLDEQLSFFTFLCCLKRIKRTGNDYDRAIADSMYQNRRQIWSGYYRSFNDMLAHCNNRGFNARDCLGKPIKLCFILGEFLEPRLVPLKTRIKKYQDDMKKYEKSKNSWGR